MAGGPSIDLGLVEEPFTDLGLLRVGALLRLWPGWRGPSADLGLIWTEAFHRPWPGRGWGALAQGEPLYGVGAACLEPSSRSPRAPGPAVRARLPGEVLLSFPFTAY